MGCVNSKPIVEDTDTITIKQLQIELFKFKRNIRGYLERKRNFCLKKSEKSQIPVPSSCTPAAEEEKKSGCRVTQEQKVSQVEDKDTTTSQSESHTHDECQQKPLAAPVCSGKVDFTSCENKGIIVKSQSNGACVRHSMRASLITGSKRIQAKAAFGCLLQRHSMRVLLITGYNRIQVKAAFGCLSLRGYFMRVSLINGSNRIQAKAAFGCLSLPIYLKAVPSSLCRSVQVNIVKGTVARSVLHPVLEVKPSNQGVESLREDRQLAVNDVVLSAQNSLQTLQLNWINVLETLHPHSNYNPDTEYRFIKHIGEGSFGQVYLARHNEDQEEEYAIKRISVHDSTDKKARVMELQILRSCSHKNILALRQSYFTREHLYIVTEYVAGVSLSTLGDVNMGLVSEKDIASIMKECLQGIAYLHDCDFIHCDIKSDNILIANDGKVKLADFGLSIKDTEERPVGFRGTPMYAAPEMANGRPYGREIDIWSLGIVAIELWQGYPPLAEVAGCVEQFKTYCQAGYCAMEEERASKASDDFMDFLYEGALMYSPVDRLTAYQLLRHLFISHADNCQGLPQLVQWALLYNELR